MKPWLIFVTICLFMTLVIVGGLLLHRRNNQSFSATNKTTEDNLFFYLFLWLASMSIMAYIAFAFGKR